VCVCVCVCVYFSRWLSNPSCVANVCLSRAHTLRSGFDQEMAKKIGSDLEARHVRMLYNTQPQSVERGADGKLSVRFSHDDGTKGLDTFDTVREREQPSKCRMFSVLLFGCICFPFRLPVCLIVCMIVCLSG
jgi:hypothetical protein